MEETSQPESEESQDRESLKVELERLQQVSAENAELARQLVKDPTPAPDLHSRIDANVEEQSRIVDRFVSMSVDQEAIESFRTILAGIESDSKALEAATQAEERKLLEQRMIEGIEKWIATLERIILGVLEGGKE